MNNTFSVKKLINLTKYQLFSNYIHIIINVAVMVLNTVIAVIVTRNAGNATGSGSLDSIFYIWIFVIGITFFGSFKFALVNGVSRNTYYWSSVITVVCFAFVLSIVSGLFVVLIESVATTYTIFTLLYGKNVLGMFVTMFAAGIFFAMLGWFISCVFYRTYRKQRLIIAAALLIIPAVFILINYYTGGALGTSLFRFMKNIMGFGMAAPNPYIASASLVTMGIILCAAIYLLVRRAGIRE